VEAKMLNTSKSNDTQVGLNFVSEFAANASKLFQLERVLCPIKKSRDLVEIKEKKRKFSCQILLPLVQMNNYSHQIRHQFQDTSTTLFTGLQDLSAAGTAQLSMCVEAKAP
jgi:hypothetical protein